MSLVNNTVEVNLLFPGASTFLKSKGRGSDLLSIFRRKDNKWIKTDFTAGKTSIRIGSASDKCDICIDGDETIDPIQTVINYLGNAIFIIERGKNSITHVNGIKTSQVVLDDKNPALMLIGKTAFILKPKRSTPSKGSIIKTPYIVKNSQGSEFKAEFGRPNLIGGNSACDIEIKGEDFIGLFLPIDKHLYFIPFSKTKVDGSDVPEMHTCVLKPISQLNNYGISITVPNSQDMPPAPLKINSFGIATLKFIEIQADEQAVGLKMALPMSGKSFLISRKNEENCFHIDSKLISRKHAQIIVYDKSILVEDCYSANGTYVNAEKISRKSVHPGDFLSVGDKTFLLGYSLRSENV